MLQLGSLVEKLTEFIAARRVQKKSHTLFSEVRASAKGMSSKPEPWIALSQAGTGASHKAGR